MKKSNSTEVLNLSAYKLPWGAIKRIAKKMGLSEGYVCYVKSGKRNNLEVSEAIAVEALKYAKRQKAIQSKLNNL